VRNDVSVYAGQSQRGAGDLGQSDEQCGLMAEISRYLQPLYEVCRAIESQNLIPSCILTPVIDEEDVGVVCNRGRLRLKAHP
jgi:hypothetical protein